MNINIPVLEVQQTAGPRPALHALQHAGGLVSRPRFQGRCLCNRLRSKKRSFHVASGPQEMEMVIKGDEVRFFVDFLLCVHLAKLENLYYRHEMATYSPNSNA